MSANDKPHETIELPRRYALGARAGHADGKLRVGAYVAGEEDLRAEDCASELKSFSVREKYWYLKGYEYGYVRGASGEVLPEWCAS